MNFWKWSSYVLKVGFQVMYQFLIRNHAVSVIGKNWPIISHIGSICRNQTSENKKVPVIKSLHIGNWKSKTVVHLFQTDGCNPWIYDQLYWLGQHLLSLKVSRLLIIKSYVGSNQPWMEAVSADEDQDFPVLFFGKT